MGLIIAFLAGFDVSVVPVFWQKFSEDCANEFDFFSTHPSDEKRIAVMRESLMDMHTKDDFFLPPLLPETPSAKDEYKTSSIQKNIQDYAGSQSPESSYQQSPESTFQQTQYHDNAQSYCYDNSQIQSGNVTTHTFQTQYHCPGCNQPIVIGDEYCNACGLNLTNLHCKNCGGSIHLTDNYCMSCGRKL